MRVIRVSALLMLVACSEEAEPVVDAGQASVDAAFVVADGGEQADAGVASDDAGLVSEDIGFAPVGDCLDDSECDDDREYYKRWTTATTSGTVDIAPSTARGRGETFRVGFRREFD